MLVGTAHGRDTALSGEESLAELERLADTAGVEVAAKAMQTVRRINPATSVSIISPTANPKKSVGPMPN